MTRGSTAAAAQTLSLNQAGGAAPPTDAHQQRTSSGRIKRWATQSVASLEDEDDEFDEVPQPHSTRGGGARTKRHKPSSSSSSPAAPGGVPGPAAHKLNSSQPKPHSAAIADKEERKMARMIRNRNAAQASRDRKKEHTQYLEARVLQLESQLDHSDGGSRAQADALKLANENSLLRAQLSLEQAETNRLRCKLEALEHSLNRLTTAITPSSAAGSAVGSPPGAGSPSFEPTFSFDTLPPLPPPSPTQQIAHSSSSSAVAVSAPAECAPVGVGSVPLTKSSSRLVAREPVLIDSAPAKAPSVAGQAAEEMTIAAVWADWHGSAKKSNTDIDDPTGSETSAEAEEDWAGSMSDFLDFSFHDDGSPSEVDTVA